MGYGHVKTLAKEIRDSFSKTEQKPVVEELYVGPYRSHRYDIVNKLVANPNYKLDTKLVTRALLDNVLSLPSLTDISREIGQDNWYILLGNASLTDIDRLVRRIATQGLVNGIEHFVRSRR